MSEFINTADVIGDDEMCDQIIMRKVGSYREDRISKIAQYAFYNCPRLSLVYAPNVIDIAANSLYGCTSLNALILRNTETVCSLGATSALTNTGIASGTGYIYVPSVFLDTYKAATNWSTYADQFRALEDYTVDGTVDGAFNGGGVNKRLYGVILDNMDMLALGSYRANLAPMGEHEIAETTITMNGVDVTNSVYSDGVIDIPVVSGDICIVANSDIQIVASSVPKNNAISGNLPRCSLNVIAGQKLRIHYYLTKTNGYLYDGRGCGSGYDNSGHTVNAHATQDVTIVSDGYIVFSDYYASGKADGEFGVQSSDYLAGQYLYVEILE